MKYALVDGKKTHIKDVKRGERGLDIWHKSFRVKACKGHYMQYWKYEDDKPTLPSGYENETEWHAAWKACVKDECCEVVCGSNSEHRADIKTDEYVIEIQNSSIPYEAVKERTKFYSEITSRRIIWIVNAYKAWRNKHITLEKSPNSKMLVVTWKYPKKWAKDICNSTDTHVYLDISPKANNLIRIWKHQDALYDVWEKKKDFYDKYLKSVSIGYENFECAFEHLNSFDY